MLWVTWRQHRAELLAGLLLLVLVAVPVVVTGTAMHADYRDGVAGCVPDPARAGCEQLVEAFTGRYREWAGRLLWAAFLPAAAGVFVGAPLLARELEQGTWRLALTQGVSRTRWLAAKLLLVGGAVAAVTAAFAALLGWWRGPLDELSGRLHATSFVVAVPSLTAASVFAFATGVLAGAALRRTVPAMVATLVAFLTVRLSLEEYARPHYLPPASRPAGAGRVPDTAWTVHSGQGIIRYHPDSRFWPSRRSSRPSSWPPRPSC